MNTIASVKRTIETLQSEKAALYKQHISHIDEKITKHKEWVVQYCGHIQDNLIVSVVAHDDEYGKYIDGWSEYLIECAGCGRTVLINKVKLDRSGKSFQEVVSLSHEELEELK